MILVDTSVWIDHLHRSDPALSEALLAGEVGVHPLVIQELALGSLRNRQTILGLLADLEAFPVLSHDEVLALVDLNRLWGRGLSSVDAHLLGSLRLASQGRLWTRDKGMQAAAAGLGIAVIGS